MAKFLLVLIISSGLAATALYAQNTGEEIPVYKNYKGLSNSQNYYDSSDYWDDLIMGALWLYIAENNNNYLDDIDSFFSSSGGVPYSDWTLCWDDVNLAAIIKLAELTDNSKYHEVIDYNLNYWQNSLRTTPGGLKYLTSWGVLRYAAAASGSEVSGSEGIRSGGSHLNWPCQSISG